MSHSYFGNYQQSAFAIHEDDTENASVTVAGKAFLGENLTKGPQVKRTALGTITSNTRVQPFRSAKQSQVFVNIFLYHFLL